jgi:hypothetical protein
VIGIVKSFDIGRQPPRSVTGDADRRLHPN